LAEADGTGGLKRVSGRIAKAALNLKAIADYESGPGSEISAERAACAVAAGKLFVEHIAGLFPPACWRRATIMVRSPDGLGLPRAETRWLRRSPRRNPDLHTDLNNYRLTPVLKILKYDSVRDVAARGGEIARVQKCRPQVRLRKSGTPSAPDAMSVPRRGRTKSPTAICGGRERILGLCRRVAVRMLMCEDRCLLGYLRA
jgi:hypothetical protein